MSGGIPTTIRAEGAILLGGRMMISAGAAVGTPWLPLSKMVRVNTAFILASAEATGPKAGREGNVNPVICVTAGRYFSKKTLSRVRSSNEFRFASRRFIG